MRLLVDRGADINRVDLQFGATPAGWVIEYLREMGAFLAIELDDLAYAIEGGGCSAGRAIPPTIS